MASVTIRTLYGNGEIRLRMRRGQGLLLGRRGGLNEPNAGGLKALQPTSHPPRGMSAAERVRLAPPRH